MGAHPAEQRPVIAELIAKAWEDLARALLLLLLMVPIAFAIGWYCGDRFDLPVISVEWK